MWRNGWEKINELSNSMDYRTRTFNVAFIRAFQYSLSWIEWIQFPVFTLISKIYVLILSSHLRNAFLEISFLYVYLLKFWKHSNNQHMSCNSHSRAMGSLRILFLRCLSLANITNSWFADFWHLVTLHSSIFNPQMVLLSSGLLSILSTYNFTLVHSLIMSCPS